MKPIITLRQVNKKYDHHKVLDSINLEVFEHQFIVLLGPSGCGKTTLLKVIAGIDQNYEGTVETRNALKPTMFFQSYALFPYLNVFDNIKISLESSNLTKKQKDDRVIEIATSLKIDHLLYRNIQDISGGEAQRVALARTMACDSSLCLMDEPLSHLDTTLRFDTMKLIKKIHFDKKWTTIYVTHDQDEAVHLSDQIILMNHGKIEQIGTYDDLYYYPKNVFVASFIGEYPINFIHGTIENNYFKSNAFKINVQTSFKGDCLLGIRKEHLILSNTKSDFSVALKNMIYKGNENIAEVLLNNIDLLVSFNKDININEPLYIHFDSNNIHLFDIHTNNKL